jgi:DNA-binding SARP family transcriptional activator
VTHTVETRIQILGPVRAWRGTGEVSLGSPQQRAVLVLLAITGGRPVPMGTLVDALWESHPPPSAVNVIQTYLKRLRRLLDPDRPHRRPSALLPTVGDGYALRADADAVDLWRFRAQVTTARQARRAADHLRVTAILSEALRQWQGGAATDVPALAGHPWLRTLASERSTATGWLAEAALASGVAAEALEIVEETAATSPLDEPLHAHLIRLYHAVGRRSDAVRTYHHARCRLRDDIGLDPGPVLSAAYRDLLRHERPTPAVG